MTHMTVAFSGLIFPLASYFQPISSLKRLRSAAMLWIPSGSLETASTKADIWSSSYLSCGNYRCRSGCWVRKRSASGSGKNLESGKALELGIPPKDVQMEEVGEWVTWGPVI